MGKKKMVLIAFAEISIRRTVKSSQIGEILPYLVTLSCMLYATMRLYQLQMALLIPDNGLLRF